MHYSPIGRPGQINFTHPGDGFGINAMRAARKVDYTDVIIHGSPNAVMDSNDPYAISYTASELATMIRAHPDYLGGKVRLVSCSTGGLGATLARDLAQELGVEVQAATNVVTADYFGNLEITQQGRWQKFGSGSSPRDVGPEW